MDVLLRGYVLKEAAKLDPENDLTIVQMPPGNMNAALERQVVDAAFTWEPFVSLALARGDARLILDVNQALPDYPWYVVVGVPKILQERPDDIAKLLRAHRKAIAFLQEHQEEANGIIAETFNLEPLQTIDGKTLAPEAIVREARKRLGWSDKLESTDLQFIQRLIDYSLALGFLNKPVTLEQIVDTRFQNNADAISSR